MEGHALDDTERQGSRQECGNTSRLRIIRCLRILCVSDLHYTLKQLDWVVGVARDYDVVVVAGDLLDIRSYVEPEAQIVVVREYLARLAQKTTVVACSGNHDLNADNELGERAASWLANARDDGVFVDGMRVRHGSRPRDGVSLVGRPADA